MIEVERTLTLQHALPDVVAYLADFAHTEEWDPGTVSCRPVRDGVPVGKGTEWENVSEFRGRRTELRYRLVRFEERRLTFVGRNRTATSTDDMTFREDGAGTRLTYRARIEFRGVARLASPFLRGEFERLGDEVVRRLPGAVDHHFGADARPAN
ncbi:SRPBCC family protein [Streptomyces sp. NPDC007084]|uniref:SRPBCC family protein n=1 Tax=Streptomyces sp. NPDC007084 TaxID=3154313 RepID=UPI0034540746